MAEITSELIKELRERTQVGMLDCKKALVECDGDIEKAIDYLRKKGIASASKKAERATKEGIIATYIHSNSKIGVMLELNCETDFVAKNEDFKELGKELCMQVAATMPSYVDVENIPEEELEREKAIYKDQMKDSGKPENVIDKIIEGKMKKYYSQVCLMEQEYIRESKQIIRDIVKEKISKYGENISIGKFVRYQIGQ
ncbi:MAG: translation elongation factor Ts [Spirochaetes bacterium]|nr:translation elongation factor Ts [Spirochaetota bacterium]